MVVVLAPDYPFYNDHRFEAAGQDRKVNKCNRSLIVRAGKSLGRAEKGESLLPHACILLLAARALLKTPVTNLQYASQVFQRMVLEGYFQPLLTDILKSADSSVPSEWDDGFFNALVLDTFVRRCAPVESHQGKHAPIHFVPQPPRSHDQIPGVVQAHSLRSI